MPFINSKRSRDFAADTQHLFKKSRCNFLPEPSAGCHTTSTDLVSSHSQCLLHYPTRIPPGDVASNSSPSSCALPASVSEHSASYNSALLSQDLGNAGFPRAEPASGSIAEHQKFLTQTPHDPQDQSVSKFSAFLDLGPTASRVSCSRGKRPRSPPLDLGFPPTSECTSSYPSKRREALWHHMASEDLENVTNPYAVPYSSTHTFNMSTVEPSVVARASTIQDVSSDVMYPSSPQQSVAVTSAPSLHEVKTLFENGRVKTLIKDEHHFLTILSLLSISDVSPVPEKLPEPISECSDLVVYRPPSDNSLGAAFDTAVSTYSAKAVERLQREIMMGSSPAGNTVPEPCSIPTSIVPYDPGIASLQRMSQFSPISVCSSPSLFKTILQPPATCYTESCSIENPSGRCCSADIVEKKKKLSAEASALEMQLD